MEMREMIDVLPGGVPYVEVHPDAGTKGDSNGEG